MEARADSAEMEAEDGSTTEQAQGHVLSLPRQKVTAKINKNINFHFSFLMVQEQFSQKQFPT